MDISFLHWLPVLGVFAGGAALGDLLGFGAAAAADVAPEVAVAAEAAPELITAGADIAPFAAGEDVLAAGGADVLGLGGLGDAAALGAGVGADALGFAAPAAADAAAAGVAPAAADLAAVSPAAGAAVESAGGVIPASSALPLPGTALDVTDVSGAGVGGLTNTGPQFASLPTASDASQVEAWAPLPNTDVSAATRLADASNVLPSSTGGSAGTGDLGVDLTAASDSSAIGGGGPLGTQAPNVPPDAMGQAGGGTTPGLGGGAAPKTPPGGGGGGFDMWKAAGLGLAAAPLAITLARGQQEMPQQGLQSQGLATAEGAAGQQLLSQAMQGQVTPGQQAALTLDRQRMINQARQQLYSQGIQNPEASSAWGGIMANIDNQMAVELQQFLTANINEAFKGTGQAEQNLTNLATQQIALDNAYTNAIANAGRGLGSVVGQAGMRLL